VYWTVTHSAAGDDDVDINAAGNMADPPSSSEIVTVPLENDEDPLPVVARKAASVKGMSE
jgi:hypothetical protein